MKSLVTAVHKLQKLKCRTTIYPIYPPVTFTEFNFSQHLNLFPSRNHFMTKDEEMKAFEELTDSQKWSFLTSGNQKIVFHC